MTIYLGWRRSNLWQPGHDYCDEQVAPSDERAWAEGAVTLVSDPDESTLFNRGIGRFLIEPEPAAHRQCVHDALARCNRGIRLGQVKIFIYEA